MASAEVSKGELHRSIHSCLPVKCEPLVYWTGSSENESFGSSSASTIVVIVCLYAPGLDPSCTCKSRLAASQDVAIDLDHSSPLSQFSRARYPHHSQKPWWTHVESENVICHVQTPAPRPTWCVVEIQSLSIVRALVQQTLGRSRKQLTPSRLVVLLCIHFKVGGNAVILGPPASRLASCNRCLQQRRKVLRVAWC